MLKNGEGGYVADADDAGPARGRGSGRRPLRRRQPERLPPRHRRHQQRARQRRRPDAAPRARGRGPHRAVAPTGSAFFTSVLGCAALGSSASVADTVEDASRNAGRRRSRGRELGLKEDEYQRIREILGRRPTVRRAGHVLGDVERALLVQVVQGAPAQFGELPAETPTAAAGRHRRERRRRRHRPGLGGHLQGRVAQPPLVRRALPGCRHRRRRHRPRHPGHGRPADRGDGPAAVRPARRSRHRPGAARRGGRRRRLRQLPGAAEHRRRGGVRRVLRRATRWSTRCASA